MLPLRKGIFQIYRLRTISSIPFTVIRYPHPLSKLGFPSSRFLVTKLIRSKAFKSHVQLTSLKPTNTDTKLTSRANLDSSPPKNLKPNFLSGDHTNFQYNAIALLRKCLDDELSKGTRKHLVSVLSQQRAGHIRDEVLQYLCTHRKLSPSNKEELRTLVLSLPDSPLSPEKFFEELIRLLESEPKIEESKNEKLRPKYDRNSDKYWRKLQKGISEGEKDVKAIKEKFGRWMPPKRIPREAMERMKDMHKMSPEQYTVTNLAAQFKISPEAVRRILSSSWQPNAERLQEQEHSKRIARRKQLSEAKNERTKQAKNEDLALRLKKVGKRTNFWITVEEEEQKKEEDRIKKILGERSTRVIKRVAIAKTLARRDKQ